MHVPTELEQFAALKSMTIRTGAIHDAQALQLRNWPLMIPGVASAEARLDVENRTLTYVLKARPVKGVIPACKEIAKLIRTYLLWDDTAIVFKAGKKVIYDSRK
jgi:hypothetical protein